MLESDFDREVLDAFGLDEPGDDRGRGVMVAVEVDGGDAVDEIHRRVGEAGVDVRMEPMDVSWGRRMAILSDPDGYAVEVSAPR